MKVNKKRPLCLHGETVRVPDYKSMGQASILAVSAQPTQPFILPLGWSIKLYLGKLGEAKTAVTWTSHCPCCVNGFTHTTGSKGQRVRDEH